LAVVPDPVRFATAYLEAFGIELNRIQQEYRKRKRGFDNLFRHRRRDEGGSFAYRWEQVLQRLNKSDPQALINVLSESIDLHAPAAVSAVG
jgi:hypothetical protein